MNRPRIAELAELAEVVDQLDLAWSRGWQPRDLTQIFDTKPHRQILVAALAANRRGWHPQAATLWADQADSLGAIVWWTDTQPFWPQFQERHGVSATQVAAALSALSIVWSESQSQPLFEAPPSQAAWSTAPGPDSDAVLAKVRALLTKAEASDFENEAEAFSAKAQELISKHSIDVTLLADVHDVPGGCRLYIDNPYAKAKFILLSGIAQANQCRAVWAQQAKTATLVGHQTDLLVVEILFTSLLVQGTSAVLASGSKTAVGGASATKSWRNAFWHGFAARIGERLAETAETAQREANAVSKSDLLPVFAKRTEAVDQALSDIFPTLGSMRASASNFEGLGAGRSFANSADVAASHRVTNVGRPSLGA